jgi:PAS domain S-box-containing protein
MKEYLRQSSVIGFGLALAVLVVGAVLGIVNAGRLAENERLVAHTHEVIGELEALLSTLKDAETGQRGYLLTENEKYLQPYDDALKRVQAIVTHLKELTSDNAEQQARLGVLETKIPVRVDELRQTVALTKGGDRPAAMKIIRSDTGKAMMDDLRDRIAVMRQAEGELLRRRAEESETSSRTTVVLILLPAVIGIVLVCIVFYLSQRNLRVQRRAAEVLAEQRERLRTTLASIGDAVISTDTEGCITNMNAVAESLTGWKKEEATGQQLDTVFRIINEETRQQVHNPAMKAMKEGVIVGLANHTVLIAKGGTELPIDDSAAPIRCAKGEVVGCVLVFRDVTERRQAERAARSLASIVESSDDAIIGKDMNGVIASWNQAAERLFGYSAAEVIGCNIAILAPSDRADEMPAILARLKEGERVEHFDTERRAKDGRLVPISLTVSPIRDGDGQIIGASKIARDITERKRTEEALRAEKARLYTTLISIRDAVIVTDAESGVTLMNPVAQALTGWTEQGVGRPLEEVFHIINEQSRQPVESPVSRVMREGTVVGLGNHTVLIARDGTERAIDDSAAPIRGGPGQVVGCVPVFRDLAEQRRAERAMAEARAYAESIVDTVREPLLILNGKLRVVSASRSFFQTFDVSPAETENRLIYELGNSQWDIPALRKLLTEILPHNTTFNDFDVEHSFPTIGHRVMRLNARRLLREGNQTELILLAIEDITVRRRLERENADRLAAARFLASIVESSADAIVSKSLSGIIQTWNAAAQRLFGYTAEQAVGQHITFIIPANRADEEEQIISRIRSGQRVDHFDTVRLRCDGQPIHVSLTISPIRDEPGHVVGASKIARDITDRKHAEERIYRLLAELKDADRRKDEFLAMLAHELRGPLAPLSNMLEIMKRAEGDSDLLQQARSTMERQLGQLLRLVDDLIDVSRITRNKIELRRERVELASIIHQSVEACRPLAECANHQVSVTLPPDPIYLHADPVRLAQVFTNILNNACKYTEPGGKIRLTAERQGSDVVVSIRDTGVGIPPDKLSSVFEMFTQIERTLERSQGGLGIGLTLVKRLVEMHDGTVTAQSEGPGRGSEFVVRLPVLIEKPEAVRGGERPTAEPTRTTACRILVVDDNTDAATSLAMLLKITGNQTETAYDGLEAVEAAAKFRPDVILLDIGLPKLNGYDACRRIREQPWGKNVVMVALTGWGQEEDRHKSKDAGFNGHLIKPVDYAALMKLLAERQPTSV